MTLDLSDLNVYCISGKLNSLESVKCVCLSIKVRFIEPNMTHQMPGSFLILSNKFFGQFSFHED